jgi:hypothetical protein
MTKYFVRELVEEEEEEEIKAYMGKMKKLLELNAFS